MSLRHRALPTAAAALKRALAVRSVSFPRGPQRPLAIVANAARVERPSGDALAFDGLGVEPDRRRRQGLPDAEIVGVASRLATIQEILDVTAT
jgi:hypothetical protein